MKRLMASTAVGCAALLGLAGVVSADGHARVVVPFDLETDGAAEGVAVDWEGNVYAGLSAQGRMLKIPDGGGEAMELAALEGLAEGDFGFAGHGFNSDGKLYSAVVSANPELNGLVAIDPETGEWLHIAGTEAMAMANALETDGWGGLWVTDSILGGVWRVWSNWDQGHGFEPVVEQWIVHPLLAGTGDLPLPFPVGANGIDVDLMHDTVYVANTEQSSIVRIPIRHDGTAGEPFVYAELPGISPDGIVLGDDGIIYVADPPAHTLWKVDPEGTVTAVADVDDGLSGPSSVALFDDDPLLPLVYVSNQAIGDSRTIEHGPSIIAVSLHE